MTSCIWFGSCLKPEGRSRWADAYLNSFKPHMVPFGLFSSYRRQQRNNITTHLLIDKISSCRSAVQYNSPAAIISCLYWSALHCTFRHYSMYEGGVVKILGTVIAQFNATISLTMCSKIYRAESTPPWYSVNKTEHNKLSFYCRAIALGYITGYIVWYCAYVLVVTFTFPFLFFCPWIMIDELLVISGGFRPFT